MQWYDQAIYAANGNLITDFRVLVEPVLFLDRRKRDDILFSYLIR